MNLSDSSDWKSNSDTSFIDCLVDDLDFKRRTASWDFSWTDFKSLKESQSINCSLEVSSEWQKDMNIFSRVASTERGSINLIISCLNVAHIFSKERKGDFCPWSVFPLSSNNKWNHSETVWSDGFDWEKLIRTVLTLEVINGYNKQKLYKLQFLVLFWIHLPMYDYSKDCQLQKWGLKLRTMIQWDDLHNFNSVPCWINPL